MMMTVRVQSVALVLLSNNLMFSAQDEFCPELTEVGHKAYRLYELVKAGYRVPPFLVITSDEIEEVFKSELDRDCFIVSKFIPEILKLLPGEEYAVRSSMKMEDMQNLSGAGQFKTVLRVSPDDLCDSIVSVIEDARKKLPHGLQDCSVIVQQYIEPDYAGVTFTRNPMGGREMVTEYRKGVGDKVVGGDRVKKIQYLSGESKNYTKQLPNIGDITDIATSIESFYGFPQDIEWACKGGVTYILQARPITSIDAETWRGIVSIESELPVEERFYFEKTPSCETFERPRPLAFSILEALHGRAGPVERAYANIRVRYISHKNLFRIFGTDLFVDKHVEIKTLFPSLGYKKANTDKPRWETLSGSFMTVKNIFHLSRLPLKDCDKQVERLERIENLLKTTSTSLAESYNILLSQYEVIFETNILAQNSLTILERHLGKQAQFLPELLRYDGSAEVKYGKNILDGNIRGNSINIDDISDFSVRGVSVEKQTGTVAFEKWWNSLPNWKRVGLNPYVKRAKEYVMLREYSRILSVCLIDNIRKHVDKLGLKIFPATSELIYFATIEELIREVVDKTICKKRKESYYQKSLLRMPQYIASFVKNTEKKNCVGVSSGLAEGVVVTKENLKNSDKKVILYTELLTPDIVQNFSVLAGIVSKHGGMLSHLAIMARESGIPIVVTNESVNLTSGEYLRINGLTGEIYKVAD